MPRNRKLLLAVAVILSSAGLAQDNSTQKQHQIVVETDSGRYGVGAQKLDPKQLGVAIYPGAKVDEREDNKSDASLFAEWGHESMRLYVQKYVTSDPADKVLSFYRKQLSKYGPVLECRHGKAVNTVSTAAKCDGDNDDRDIELKAGTDKKQHIVGMTPIAKGTEFGLVFLEQSGTN